MTHTLDILQRMLHNANRFHLLHSSQFGSRPGSHALGAVFLKLLSYEICRFTRTPFASFDNDAKSCYDRIVISMATLGTKLFHIGNISAILDPIWLPKMENFPIWNPQMVSYHIASNMDCLFNMESQYGLPCQYGRFRYFPSLWPPFPPLYYYYF